MVYQPLDYRTDARFEPVSGLWRLLDLATNTYSVERWPKLSEAVEMFRIGKFSWDRQRRENFAGAG